MAFKLRQPLVHEAAQGDLLRLEAGVRGNVLDDAVNARARRPEGLGAAALAILRRRVTALVPNRPDRVVLDRLRVEGGCL
jgi:hypothetical protein